MLFWIKDFIYVQESLIFYIQYIHTYILTNTNFSIQPEQCIIYSNHSRVCVYMLVHDIHSSTLNKLKHSLSKPDLNLLIVNLI